MNSQPGFAPSKSLSQTFSKVASARVASLAILTATALTGCSLMKRVFTPGDFHDDELKAMQERDHEKAIAEMKQVPDGECASGEQCHDYCKALARALDCYRTGNFAMRGVDVHTAGGYKTERVSGSTDDVKVVYEAATTEHQSLIPLAREAYGRACAADHPESCRRSGGLTEKHDPKAARVFYQKGCTLHDQPACDALAKFK